MTVDDLGFIEGADLLNFDVSQAIREVFNTYGVKVSVSQKKKSLNKFGRNQLTTNAVTGSTIMTLPAGQNHETYVSTNAIDTVSSSSTSDTEEIVIEGHTISGSDFTFVVQTITLTGQTKAVLSTPLARVSRMYNNNGTDLVGSVYCYEDDTLTAGVPDTGTKVHAIIRAGKNNTEKCATTLSSTDYWFVTEWGGSVLEKTAAFADVELEVAPFGKVFRVLDALGVASGATVEESFSPYLIVPANSDVRVVGVASAAGKQVAASIHGYLATVIG